MHTSFKLKRIFNKNMYTRKLTQKYVLIYQASYYKNMLKIQGMGDTYILTSKPQFV